MLKKSKTLEMLAHTIYAILAVVAIAPLLILWGKATLVGMIAAVFIVFMPLLAIWLSVRKRNRNMRRPAAKLRL